MLKRINLIKNVGCFDTFAGSSLGDLENLVLMYAENGRGKTTISSILSSLANNDASIINNRKRLGSANDPHVVLDIEGQSSNVMFQSGSWNISYDNIYVYDDEFVNQNVFSGLEISPSHRQNLHEIILGRKGVVLARKVKDLAQQITNSNSRISYISNQIPMDQRFGLEVDVFCGLKEVDDVEKKIVDKQRIYDAIKQADTISRQKQFSHITLPEIDETTISATLSTKLSDLDESAMKSITDHFSLIGENGEKWVSDGIGRIINAGTEEEQCPFCGQEIDGVDLISKYRVYFSEAYKQLIQGISAQTSHYTTDFGGDNLSSKQQEITKLLSLFEFWKNFVELPETKIDWQDLSTAWQEARNGVLSLLQTKNSSPLTTVDISTEIKEKIDRYFSLHISVMKSIEVLTGYNTQISKIKEQAETGNLENVTNELKKIKATQSRYSDELKELCDQYRTEATLKSKLERQKEIARTNLDNHREAVFSKYHTAINKHLELFGANFRIGGLESSNAAGRPSTTYHVVMDQHRIQLADQDGPCFKNALSAGDRNALGLAFFFASLDAEPDLQDSIIVLDDPISSLDDGRTTTTIQKIRNLIPNSSQLIVLCHSRSFLCDIWQDSDKNNTMALKILRGPNNTSTITLWDVRSDALTEYDKRHEVLRNYIEADTQEKRYVAECLRPVMEKYLRVVFPQYFLPGNTLGNFRNRVEQLKTNGKSIMVDVDIWELRDITDYANKFHHDTNPDSQTEQINDNELVGFVKRVIKFTSHGPT